MSAAGLEMFSLEGTSAVVTGGTRGIGFMIARALLLGGARVSIVGRDPDQVAASATQLGEFGPCVGLVGDISSEAGCEAVARAVLAGEGGVQVLVNNAGMQVVRPLEESGEADFASVLATNLTAVFSLSRLLAPALGSGERPGRIINVGSIDGMRVPRRPNYGYASSKAGVHQLTRLLAKHLAPNVLVNAVAPGPFDTDMARKIRRDAGATEWPPPLVGHIGGADDIAGLVIYLASQASRFMTGSILQIDGGAMLE